MPAGYSKRSLIEKLGIKPASRIAIVHPPPDFEETLGPLPDGMVALSAVTRDLDYIHAFFTRASALEKEFASLRRGLRPAGTLWISWPKKAAKMDTDLTENVIRDTGLTHGLVDVKVCAVDEVWSGLKFMYRLKDR